MSLIFPHPNDSVDCLSFNGHSILHTLDQNIGVLLRGCKEKSFGDGDNEKRNDDVSNEADSRPNEPSHVRGGVVVSETNRCEGNNHEPEGVKEGIEVFS